MRKYTIHEVSGNASHQKSNSLPDASGHARDNKPHIIDSAKVMSTIGVLLLIFGVSLLLLFVAWMGK